MAFAVTNNFFGSGFLGAGTRPMPDPMGSEAVTIRCASILNGTGAINDVVQLAKLPAGCVVVDWALDNDDLDTGTGTLTFDLGVIIAGAVSAAAADGGKWLTASGAGAAPALTVGHHQAAAAALALARMSAAVAERAIGLVVIAAGNAGATANSVVGLTLTYRSAYAGN